MNPRLGKLRRVGAPGTGMGGGYEKTDPDYDEKRIARLRAEYRALEPRWRKTFLISQNQEDRRLITQDTQP